MPSKTQFESKGVLCTYSGPCGLRDVLHCMHEFMTHERYEKFRYVIHDCTDVKTIALDETDMIAVVAQAIGAEHTNNKVKGAIVLNNDAGRALLEKYTQLTNRTVAEFATLLEARAWAATL